MKQGTESQIKGVEKDTKEFLWTTGNVFYIVSLFFLIFFLVNSSNWFGAKLDTMSIIVYLGLILGFMRLADLNKTDILTFKTETKWQNTWKPRSLLTQSFFVLCGFSFTWAVMLVLLYTGNIKTDTIVRSQAFGLMSFFFIVAFVEEVVFRGILVNMIKDGTKNQIILYGITQGAFALFHGAVYGWNARTIGFAFGAGCVWLYIAQKYGLGFTIGSHWLYDSFLAGITSGGITGSLS